MSSMSSLYGGGEEPRRPWGVALAGSLGVYLSATALLVAVLALCPQTPREKEVEITFLENVERPAPPPPPTLASAPLVAAAPAPAAAPVVPSQLKVRRLDKPPPRRELVAPKVAPQAPPKEVAPELDPGVAVVGEPGQGDPAGLEGGTAKGVAGGEVGITELPAGATAPVPLSSNEQPRYPRQARRSGKTGVVVLKIAILADGKVGEVQLQSGEEPFVAAATESVRRWRYKPAMNQGVAIAVYRIVRIKFELDT